MISLNLIRCVGVRKRIPSVIRSAVRRSGGRPTEVERPQLKASTICACLFRTHTHTYTHIHILSVPLWLDRRPQQLRNASCICIELQRSHRVHISFRPEFPAYGSAVHTQEHACIHIEYLGNENILNRLVPLSFLSICGHPNTHTHVIGTHCVCCGCAAATDAAFRQRRCRNPTRTRARLVNRFRTSIGRTHYVCRPIDLTV